MSEPPLPPPPPPRPPSAAQPGPVYGPPSEYPAGPPEQGSPEWARAQPWSDPRPSGPGTPWKAARERRPVRVWDAVVTSVLLICTFGLTLLLSYFGLFFAMASDACMGGNDCDGDLIGWGVLVAAGGVWLPFIAALVVSIVLLVVRRLAFWVPLAGMALSFGFTVLGGWMASVGSGT
ncbi:DUF6264 family protein [Rathayibacter oskolensis]|uniref:DUF6264 family protein n=1 Tax=Rathayibacter oskolensis TaxID=1891671 RepID=UPI00101AE221|nr:DUF6264 family protein [Rathayibacter oskolensis]